MTEDKMFRQHHQLNGHECEQTPGDTGGQRNLVGYSPWGCKELDTSQPLNNNNTDDLQQRCKIRAMRKKMVFPTNILKQLNIQFQLNNKINLNVIAKNTNYFQKLRNKP